jgi:hypothetical protein
LGGVGGGEDGGPDGLGLVNSVRVGGGQALGQTRDLRSALDGLVGGGSDDASLDVLAVGALSVGVGWAGGEGGVSVGGVELEGGAGSVEEDGSVVGRDN